jgi:hypothetical protein
MNCRHRTATGSPATASTAGKAGSAPATSSEGDGRTNIRGPQGEDTPRSPWAIDEARINKDE